MNFFVYRTVAERYAQYRPYFHPLVMDRIKAYLNLQRPVDVALDVGCGPGQSTTALKAIADLVVGADISAEMLDFVERQSGIQYIQSSAEVLAIKNSSAAILTTSLAYHWFHQERFLAEARRILQDAGWLIIYNNGFSGQMKENAAFEPWVTQVYVKRYPTPARNSVPMTSELAGRHGFRFAHQEDYQNEVELRAEELSAYLLTQSNVIAATEQGQEEVQDVYDWLMTQTRPFFKQERATFVFDGYIWYLQKDS
jgi:ubiquinone/menaquinone biosynthesis C-methylase UbiE